MIPVPTLGWELLLTAPVAGVARGGPNLARSKGEVPHGVASPHVSLMCGEVVV